MSRRLVVVLFLDLVGWTRLSEQVDPEPLQQMLEQYYEICSTAVDEHDGAVEKFIGDAVMAVFGALRTQEDDALRALRAAARIRTLVAGLVTPGAGGASPRIHCGIAAGEALVSHSPRAGLRVIGDVVNLAARLQSKAGPDEIVVNETVARLTGAHVGLTPIAPLTLKGKAEPVPASLVSGPVPEHAAPIDDGPMVDRHDERARIRAAYDLVVSDGRARTLMVLGAPGIGKTRLVREALSALDAVSVVTGTCPSHGPDGNHTALAGMLAELVEVSAAARARLEADPRMAAVVAGLRGDTPADREAAGPGVEEVARVVRELLGAAAHRPVVVVWDSLEWAGPSLLRLVGETAAALADRPVLTICAGRPELLESAPMWLRAGDALDVGALAPDDSRRLAGLLTPEAEVLAHDVGALDRAVTQSAGNPLLLRLLVESAGDRAAGEVPPTVTAVVGASLDRLPAPARDVLGPASVIGSVFGVEELALLGTPPLPVLLDELIARQVIRPDGAAGRYRFVQQPVHEVAYGRLDKRQRLTWHRTLADRGVSPAFHLDAALGLLTDIRPDDPDRDDLATATARALLIEGTIALRQRDLPAAISLLDRALRRAPDGPDRAVAAVRLSDALLLTGDSRRAVEVVAGVALQSTDPGVRATCAAQHRLLAVRLGSVSRGGDAPEDGSAGVAGPLARSRLAQVEMLTQLRQGRYAAAEKACLDALEPARGDRYELDRLLVALCEIRQWAPTPVDGQIASCAGLATRFAGDRVLLVPVLAARARGLALLGEGVKARAVLAEAQLAVDELNLHMGRVLIDQTAGLAAALDGDHAGAERHFRRAADVVERAGHTAVALTLRAQAARESHGSGQPEALTGLLARTSEMDFRGRLLCLSAAARAGLVPPEEAAVLLPTTDDPCLRGDALFDLARAYRQRGDEDVARSFADASCHSYAVVGATRPIEVVRAWT